MSQGLLRILTAVVGIPVLLGAIYAGSYWFGIVVAVIALLAAYEVGKLMQSTGAEPIMVPGLALCALVLARPWFPDWDAAAAVIFTAIVLSTAGLRGERPVQRLAATTLMVAYPAWMLSFLVLIREGTGLQVDQPTAMWLTVMLFVMIWAGDTFAYYTGRLVGRTPFFPSVSPRKTWEGFFGGVAGAALAGALVKQMQLPFLGWSDTIIVILICGVLGPVGDLAESRLKRSAEAKDSGSLLPGHGGLLDRFDAMIVCAPLVWLYLAFLSGVR